MTIPSGSRILVTGASGMVGSALVRALAARGGAKVLAPARSELDLLDEDSIERYFAAHRPEYVFMIAAKVGGILANKNDPVGFLTANVRMQNNLFAACHRHRTRKNLFLGSSCVYPRDCAQPMKEEYLLTGPLEPTNEGYALAKIMGLKLARYYFEQYGMRTACPMACNIYGTNDSFDPEQSHVLSALVRRFVEAKAQNAASVTLWGTGAAMREFIHVDDVAQGLLFLMDRLETPDIVNLGPGSDIPIRDLAALIAARAGYRGQILYDSAMPDGMPRKCLEVSRLKAMGFAPRITLEEGIERTIAEYRKLREEQPA